MIAGIILKLLASVLALMVAAAIYFVMGLLGALNVPIQDRHIRLLQICTVVTLIAIWVIPV